MSRRIRVLGALLASILAVLLGACGANHPSTTTAAPDARTDAALAQRMLSEQLSVLHRALPGAWRENAAASDGVVCGDSATRAGRTARAVSQSIGYKRMEVRAVTYVFASSQAASRALPAFAADALQTCRAQFFVAVLRRRGYTMGLPHAHAGTLTDIGQGANTTEITVPSRYKGRPFTWNLDETVVRNGRLIELLGTLAGASTARYNQALAAAIVKVLS
jgi:hypothetical protein